MSEHRGSPPRAPAAALTSSAARALIDQGALGGGDPLLQPLPRRVPSEEVDQSPRAAGPPPPRGTDRRSSPAAFASTAQSERSPCHWAPNRFAPKRLVISDHLPVAPRRRARRRRGRAALRRPGVALRGTGRSSRSRACAVVSRHGPPPLAPVVARCWRVSRRSWSHASGIKHLVVALPYLGVALAGRDQCIAGRPGAPATRRSEACTPSRRGASVARRAARQSTSASERVSGGGELERDRELRRRLSQLAVASWRPRSASAILACSVGTKTVTRAPVEGVLARDSHLGELRLQLLHQRPVAA